MVEPLLLSDKDEIETYLRCNPELHIYEIGDLDDFFWPYTKWYGLKQNGRLVHLALLYTASDPAVLLSLNDRTIEGLSDWFQALFPLLPSRLQTHLSPGLSVCFQDHFHRSSQASMYKMALTEPGALPGDESSNTTALQPSDLEDLFELYQTSYPDNAFDPRMLETGCFFGVRRSGKLASVAGIHVYSPAYRVAALGNVTTHPEYRRQGLGRSACVALCRHLRQRVNHIGLNVHHDNLKAIGLYEQLGFRVIAPYEESFFEKR